MFFNMAFLIELSLLIAFAGFSYAAGAAIAFLLRGRSLSRALSLWVAGLAGILSGWLLAWLSHALLLVLFPNDSPFLQAGDLLNMGILAVAVYYGMAGRRAKAA